MSKKYNIFNILSSNSDDEYTENKWTQVKTKRDNKKINTEIIKDNKNLKKILCYNIITNNVCNYGNKCLYAHTLTDQNIDRKRKIAYDIIINKKNLDKINLKINYNLYTTLLELTKVCELCINNKCTGGYNCKYGSCLKKYCICLKDINYGNCKDKCGLIHLTEYGLNPYYEKEKSEHILKDVIKEKYDEQTDEQSDDDDLSFSDDSVEIIDEFNVSIFERKIK